MVFLNKREKRRPAFFMAAASAGVAAVLLLAVLFAGQPQLLQVQTASADTSQPIVFENMQGFQVTFPPSECCTPLMANLTGTLSTKNDGKQDLSPMKGTLVIGARPWNPVGTEYEIQFKPYGSVVNFASDDGCTSITRSSNIGEAKLKGMSDDKVINGNGHVSWQKFSNCFGSSFAAGGFSVTFQDDTGHVITAFMQSNYPLSE